jgi:hypothetical protein
MLRACFEFLPEAEEEPIHPFSGGTIVVETASGRVTSSQPVRCGCPFLLLALTELLYGIAELLRSPEIKTYAFTPPQSDIDLVFERRKQASFALRYRNRLLGVYPEYEVYAAFQEAAAVFAAHCQHRFLPSAGYDQSDSGAIKDVVGEWTRASDQFRVLDPRSAAPAPDTAPKIG